MDLALEPWVAFTLFGALLFAVGNALQKYGLAGFHLGIAATAVAFLLQQLAFSRGRV